MITSLGLWSACSLDLPLNGVHVRASGRAGLAVVEMRASKTFHFLSTASKRSEKEAIPSEGRQQKYASRLQAVVKERYDAVLKLGIQIDEDIPAREQIEAREGRVSDNVLDRENDLLPHILLHPIAVVISYEKATKALLAYIARDIGGIAPVRALSTAAVSMSVPNI